MPEHPRRPRGDIDRPPDQKRGPTTGNQDEAEKAEAVNLRAAHSARSILVHSDRWAEVMRFAYRIARTPTALKVTAVRYWAAATEVALGVEVRA